MRHIHCLNNISKHGTDLLDPQKYALTDNFEEAEGVLQVCALSLVQVQE